MSGGKSQIIAVTALHSSCSKNKFNFLFVQNSLSSLLEENCVFRDMQKQVCEYSSCLINQCTLGSTNLTSVIMLGWGV